MMLVIRSRMMMVRFGLFRLFCFSILQVIDIDGIFSGMVVYLYLIHVVVVVVIVVVVVPPPASPCDRRETLSALLTESVKYRATKRRWKSLPVSMV